MRISAQVDVFSPLFVGLEMEVNLSKSEETGSSKQPEISKEGSNFDDGTATAVEITATPPCIAQTAKPSQTQECSNSNNSLNSISKYNAYSEAVSSSYRQGPGNINSNSGQSSSSATLPSRRLPPSKQRYRKKRAAFKIVERFKNTPEDTLTTVQRELLGWATKFVELIKREDTKDLAPKRPCEESNVDCKRTKCDNATQILSKHTASKALNGETREPSILAIIDKSHVDGSITTEKWKSVYLALNSIFLDILDEFPGPPPSCRDAGWHQGHVKLITCSDRRSTELYRIAVGRLGELWPGAKLAAVNKEEIPSRPRARTWIPSASGDSDNILKIINKSNPRIPTKNWKVIRFEETRGDAKQVVLSINRESLTHLASSGGVINYGFGSITLKVYKRDADGIPVLGSDVETTSVNKIAPIVDPPVLESAVLRDHDAFKKFEQ